MTLLEAAGVPGEMILVQSASTITRLNAVQSSKLLSDFRATITHSAPSSVLDGYRSISIRDDVGERGRKNSLLLDSRVDLESSRMELFSIC